MRPDLTDMPHPDPQSGAEEYANLPYYAAHRYRELSAMLASWVTITDDYARLIARVVWVLGGSPPTSEQDRVVRDLLADTFDFMVEWRRLTLEGRPTVAYPIARRAFESLSLLSACAQDTGIAGTWAAGREIGNATIRAALARLRFPESETQLRAAYRFFSKGSHPNRDLVGGRHLGLGNKFVLGSIAKPDLVFTLDHCLRLLEMWFWFAAVTAFFFREPLDRADLSFGKDYLAVADRVSEVESWLAENFDRVLKEAKASRP